MADTSVKGVNLEGMTAQELTALIQAAEAMRVDKQQEAKQALIAEFREKASQLGLELDALMPGHSSGAVSSSASSPSRRTRRDAGGSVPVRFRGPNGETWTGRGRMPKWLSAMEADGRKRDDFRV